MALKNEIKLNNGVVTKYHRIVSLNKVTNIENLIEVASYISKEKRMEEKKYQELQRSFSDGKELTDNEKEQLDNGIDVFIETVYISKNYDENETISDAYNYLKTLDLFKNAEFID